MMLISSKGRYALRVMVDLARCDPSVYTPLKEIASRQELSLKYLESIMVLLSKAGMVEGAHGRGGGYHLVKKPEGYTMDEILVLTEGTLSAVGCQAPSGCDRADHCPTRPMWEKLDALIDDFFHGITLSDLIEMGK